MTLREKMIMMNSLEELPPLHLFRQINIGINAISLTDEGGSESNGNCESKNLDNIDREAENDANANVETHSQGITTSGNKNQINYDEMYSLNEEIPVMGYTSGDESTAMRVLTSEDHLLDGGPIHKLLSPPDIESKPDALCSQLVIKDISLLAKNVDKPTIGGLANRSNCHNLDYNNELKASTSNSNSKYNLVNQNYRGRKSENYARRTRVHLRHLSPSGDLDDDENKNFLSRTSIPMANLGAADRGSSPNDDAETCGKFAVDSDEPIHMTLEEVRSSLHNLNGYLGETSSSVYPSSSTDAIFSRRHKSAPKSRGKKIQFGLCLKPRQAEDGEEVHESTGEMGKGSVNEPVSFLSKSFKHALHHWFGLSKGAMSAHILANRGHFSLGMQPREHDDAGSTLAIVNRALPPVPKTLQGTPKKHLESSHVEDDRQDGEATKCPTSSKTGTEENVPDFASSIQKVKDCGWYWGPISGEMAEKILTNEPDGSFILRDSSDEYYIFSLTFKLNGFVRHVRIEHEQGNFSFGTFTKFKSHTIVEFIENAVEHSRSGRFLFFIHRRPVLGPVRVQLLHPVSRFKRVQSLQHTCRFAILKVVRRDHVDNLPLPERLKEYLNTPQYYAEQMQEWQNTSVQSPAVPNVENSDTEA